MTINNLYLLEKINIFAVTKLKKEHTCISFLQKNNNMKTKKLTDKEFVELVINKELEIANADIRYKDIVALSKEEQDKLEFYTKFTFKTLEEFLEWRDFFYKEFYNWQPKRVSKDQMKREFGWFNLQWGLKCDFDTDIIPID